MSFLLAHRHVFACTVSILLVIGTLPASFAGDPDNSPFPLGALGGRAFQTPGSNLLKVTEVPAGSPAETAGLQVGDRIFAVDGANLSIISSSINEGWRGAVSELGYAIERAESSTGTLSLSVLRPGLGAVTINATLPATTAWRPSYPTGDPRADALFEKACADLHTKIQASSTANFAYNTGWFGMTLLASPNWNDTSGAKPYRNSINKLRDRCVSYLNGRILEPVEPDQPGYVSPGLENWDIASSCMFIGEYRRKTGDTSVDADVQRCALLLANRIQHYDQPSDSGTMYTNKHGLMGHGGVTGDYAHLWLTGINIINAHTTVAMGILKGAGADFSALAGSSGLTIDEKFLTNWDWLKKCTRTDGNDDDGCVGYQGVESGWDAAGRTAGTAAGYQIYLDSGGTAPTADDLDKLARQKAYVARQWQRQQHAHAYSAGGVALSQALMPFLEDRSQRYFMENSRFLYTLSRNHTGAVQYMPGRGNNGGDSNGGYLGYDNVKYYLSGLTQAMGTGNLPSFPAPSATRAFVRMNSPLNDWPQLDARRVKVTGFVHTLDLDVTDNLGAALTSGYTAAWSQVSGATVSFSSTTTEDTSVTFPAAGNYRLRLIATVGSHIVTEYYDFEVSAAVTPPVTNQIVTQPSSRTTSPGGNAVFAVTTSGDGPFLYEWSLNGVVYWDAGANPQLTLSNVSSGMAGTYQCTVYTPTGSLVSNSATLNLTTTPTVTAGGLRREIWNGLSGSAITDLTSIPGYPEIPDSTQIVTSAETPENDGDSYGQRLSGWLIPPTTGQYQFYISSDDSSELWLSTTDNAADKVKIAFKNGWVDFRAYSSGGQSTPIDLTAGQRYYIEILHKEGGGGDHLSVAWQIPGAAVPANGSAPINGAYLESIVDVGNPEYDGLVSWWKLDDASGSTAVDYFGSNDGTVSGATWIEGKDLGALGFDGSDSVTCGNTGALSGTTPFTSSAWVNIGTGSNQEGVIVQQRAPNGFNGQYQLKVSSAGKATFYAYGGGAQQFNFSGATPINDGQWHHVAGVRDAVGNAYIYLDGALDGSVTGTTVCNLSSSINIGIGADIRDSNKYFRGIIDDVRVYSRALSQAEVLAQVGGVSNTAPAFTSDPMTGTEGTQDVAYSGSLAGSATDPDSDTTLIYSITDGPAWLAVTPGGALSGTPGSGDVGANAFTVRVTDNFAFFDEAVLNIAVANVNDPPAFTSDPVTKSQATPDSNYADSLTSDAIDADGDPITYEKLSGPAWLLVASDGTLTGTPAAGDAGENSFIIRISDPYGSSYVGLVSIQVGPSTGYPADSYGSLAGNNASDEFIQRVQFSDIDNNSGNNGGYEDFKTLVAQLNPGQAVDYTLTPGWTSTLYNEAWTIWIDLNRDGDFADAGEVVLQIAADKLAHSGSITIPASASVGASRMRVAMKYVSSNGGAGQTSPTGTFSYGEVEDYSVRIGSSPSANAAPYFTADPITKPSLDQGIAVSASLSGDAEDWEGQPITFTKVSGPAWLSVSNTGELGGTPANSDVGVNTFTVQVSDPAAATDTATLHITVTLTPSQTWSHAHFGEDAINPHISGDHADPDGDGLHNLIEYALGTDPNIPSLSGIVDDMQNVAGSDHLRLTIAKNPAATDVTFSVETCDDLVGWSSATTLIETDTADQLIVRDTETGNRRFIRLNITR